MNVAVAGDAIEGPVARAVAPQPPMDEHRDNATEWVYGQVVARDPGSAGPASVSDEPPL